MVKLESPDDLPAVMPSGLWGRVRCWFRPSGHLWLQESAEEIVWMEAEYQSQAAEVFIRHCVRCGKWG